MPPPAPCVLKSYYYNNNAYILRSDNFDNFSLVLDERHQRKDLISINIRGAMNQKVNSREYAFYMYF